MDIFLKCDSCEELTDTFEMVYGEVLCSDCYFIHTSNILDMEDEQKTMTDLYNWGKLK